MHQRHDQPAGRSRVEHPLRILPRPTGRRKLLLGISAAVLVLWAVFLATMAILF